MIKGGPVALVADDHDMSRVALAGVLTTRLGFGRVLEAGSLEEALARLGAAAPVDVGLFDLDMPGMAGAGALASVREHFPALRMVVVSGSTRRDDILAALAAGAHGYVPKSMRLDEIARALGRVLAGEVYVPPSLANLRAEFSVPPSARSGGDALIAPAASPGLDEPPPSLTSRQAEILELLRQGKSNKEIGRLTKLAAGTVKIHVGMVLRALNVSNRTAAATLAERLIAKVAIGEAVSASAIQGSSPA